MFDIDLISDGTYFRIDEHSTFDYGARWNYGFIVATEEIGTVAPVALWNEPRHYEATLRNLISDIPDRTLYGVWTDPETGRVYVDKVQHVDSATDALHLAREHDQIAIYDLRSRSVITL